MPNNDPLSGHFEAEHEPYPWPTDNDDLTTSNGNVNDHAIIGWRQADEARISGFRKSAEILADSFIQDSTHKDLDTIVFPYITCWRHYMELHIKYLIGQFQNFLGKSVQLRGGHKVDQLWSELEALLKEAELSETREERRNANRIIGQLAELDPDSQNFRYWERRDGTQPLANVLHIDLPNFHQVMLGVANYLSAIETAIYVQCELNTQD